MTPWKTGRRKSKPLCILLDDALKSSFPDLGAGLGHGRPAWKLLPGGWNLGSRAKSLRLAEQLAASAPLSPPIKVSLARPASEAREARWEGAFTVALWESLARGWPGPPTPALGSVSAVLGVLCRCVLCQWPHHALGELSAASRESSHDSRVGESRERWLAFGCHGKERSCQTVPRSSPSELWSVASAQARSWGCENAAAAVGTVSSLASGAPAVFTITSGLFTSFSMKRGLHKGLACTQA